MAKKRVPVVATLAERVAVLETELQGVAAKLAANSAVLEGIDKKLTGQKGFIAGMVFVITTAWAAIVAIVQYWPSR